MNPRRTTYRVVASLAVLIFTGAFHANLAYAQLPETPIALGQQFTTGPTPNASVVPSAQYYSVITGFKSFCTVIPSASTAPAVLATLTYPGGFAATWPITPEVPNGSISYDGAVPGVVPPGGSVTFAPYTPFAPFPLNSTCKNTITWASGSEAQMLSLTILGRVRNNQGMTFWTKELFGQSPSLATTASPGPAGTTSLITRIEGTCVATTPYSSALLMQLIITAGTFSFPVLGVNYTPEVLTWDSGPVAYSIAAGATFSLSPVGTGTFPFSQCVIGVAGVAGTAAQIQQIPLSLLGLADTSRQRSAPDVTAAAGRGPVTPHTFKVSATQPLAILGLLASCTVPTPGLADDAVVPLATFSMTSGGTTLVFPVLPLMFGQNEIYYGHGAFPASVDPGTSVTFTGPAPFPDGTKCADTVTLAVGSSESINTIVLNNSGSQQAP
jgi:hypothetical protein